MNIWDILILLAVAAAVLLALRQLRRPRSGCCEAGGSCAGCAGACACRPRNEQPESEKTKP